VGWLLISTGLPALSSQRRALWAVTALGSQRWALSAGLSALGCHSAELSALSCHLSSQCWALSADLSKCWAITVLGSLSAGLSALGSHSAGLSALGSHSTGLSALGSHSAGLSALGYRRSSRYYDMILASVTLFGSEHEMQHCETSGGRHDLFGSVLRGRPMASQAACGWWQPNAMEREHDGGGGAGLGLKLSCWQCGVLLAMEEKGGGKRTYSYSTAPHSNKWEKGQGGGAGSQLSCWQCGVLLAMEEKGGGNVLIPTVPLLTPINGKNWSSPIFDTRSLCVNKCLIVVFVIGTSNYSFWMLFNLQDKK